MKKSKSSSGGSRLLDSKLAADIGKAASSQSRQFAGYAKKTTKVKAAKQDKPVKEGKNPSAKDVRTALKGGHITPEEASGLNSAGGLTPKAKDVRDAVAGGHITLDEAASLNKNSLK